MARWRCQKCGGALNAPEKIRKNNIKRYCLPCSERTGKLIERTCIAVATRQAKTEASKKKAQAKKKEALERARAEAAKEINKYPWNLYRLFEEWKKLDCWDDPDNIKNLDLEIRKKHRGITTECVLTTDGRKKVLMKAGSEKARAIYQLMWILTRFGNPEHEQAPALVNFSKQVFGIEISSPGQELLYALREHQEIYSWEISRRRTLPTAKPPKKKEITPKQKLARSLKKRERNSSW